MNAASELFFEIARSTVRHSATLQRQISTDVCDSDMLLARNTHDSSSYEKGIPVAAFDQSPQQRYRSHQYYYFSAGLAAVLPLEFMTDEFDIKRT